MSTRSLRSGITLVVTVALLVVAGMWAVKAISKPFPALSTSPKVVTCSKYEVVTVVKRKEVTVSVYNATRKSGLAKDTMHKLEKRGFLSGDIGNITAKTPKGAVTVSSPVQDDPAAQLVARQFQPAATVVSGNASTQAGPGINVVLGPKFDKMNKGAPKQLRLSKPSRTCVAPG